MLPALPNFSVKNGSIASTTADRRGWWRGCRDKSGRRDSFLASATYVAKAFIPPRIQSVVGDGVFDGAIGLVRVGAVGEAAKADVGPNVAIEAGDFFGHDVPKLKLPDAGRIDDEAADFERNQAGDRGGVFAFFVLAADFADAKGEFWLDGVEERRFSHAALSGDNAFLADD